ncbi:MULTISPECIES: N-acetylmuramoyl-L-alanine amidase [Bacillales]|nr:N-acetylmuramoyl-L-alanine amidase [Bacillus cereus]PED33860.1 cell wall hydrolase [Bacillus cereus]PEE52053.1 cell wall hydrolase [Bacillus cereus]PFL90899.1 cell wall hydrolase [Bacillus cereus]PFV69470.1 cell wall hydrolase [Bacillus cereus]PGS34930.1 cell wall hydrolase [Bacillus cereus]
MDELVVLDAGHGAHDSGAVGNGLTEKERALTLTKMVDEELRANGVRTYLTRSTDVFVTLSGRAAVANQKGAKIFVSFHLNSGGGTGYESFVYLTVDAKTQRLQDLLHAEAMKVLAPLGFKDRGKKKADLAVVRETNMPAVLTENGFIDNATDMSHIRQDVVLRKLAKAYAKSICTYLGKGFNEGGSGSTGGSNGGDGRLGVAYIEGTNVNLRNTPSTSGAVIRKLNNPESYIVWYEENGWLNLGGKQFVFNDPSYIRFVRA